MDCTYTGIETTPLWLINSTIYPTSALPPHHRYNGRALILNSAFIEENDTTYQCSFDLFDSRSGSICQLRSTVGKLIVVASGEFVFGLSLIPYSRKIWRGIKFGGLAVCVKTAKLKSAKFFYACMYVWRYRTIPPNLIPIMVLKTSFWGKPPNLMTANISGYTVC